MDKIDTSDVLDKLRLSELCERMSSWNRSKVNSLYTEEKVMDISFQKYNKMLCERK